MEKGLIRRLESPLSKESEDVQIISAKLRWKPETAIERVKKALPSPVEQQAYLIIGKEALFGIRPENFRKILRFFQEKDLREEDMEDVFTSEGYRFNRFEECLDHVVATLSLMEKFQDFGLSASPTYLTAARLIIAYGEEGAEGVLETINNNLPFLAARCGFKNLKLPKAMAVITNEVAKRAAEGGGMLNAISEEDIAALFHDFVDDSSLLPEEVE